MRLARCRIDHDFFHIRIFERIKNRLEVALIAPVRESLVNVIPVPEEHWQITPRRPSRPDPKDRIEKESFIATRSAFTRWNMWLDEGPFFIGEGVARLAHVILSKCLSSPIVGQISSFAQVSQQRLGLISLFILLIME